MSKMHPCPLATQVGCTDFFATSGHAAQHVKEHTGHKKICPECNKTFTRRDNMEKHKRTQHDVTRNVNGHEPKVEKPSKPTKHTSWTATPPMANTSDLIASLPAELRNRIYHLTLLEDSEIVLDGRRGTPMPPLLLTCKYIRREALPVFYGAHAIILQVDLAREGSVPRLCTWLRSTTTACDSATPFGSWAMAVTGPVVLGMLSMLPLFDTLRELGMSKKGLVDLEQPLTAAGEAINVASRLSVSDGSFFYSPSIETFPDSHGRVANFLDSCFGMAEKAHTEGWGQEMFARQYRHAVTQRVGFRSSSAMTKIMAKKPAFTDSKARGPNPDMRERMLKKLAAAKKSWEGS